MKYELVCDADVARVSSTTGKVLIEVGRTCPLCGASCDIELRYKALKRTCKKCDREWEKPFPRRY